MQYLLKNVNIHEQDREERRDLVLMDGQLIFDEAAWPTSPRLPLSGHQLHLFPGFTDVHVHLREPGFSYKETIGTGSLAAARGGFTTVCTMPNLKPVPDSLASLQVQLDLIKQNARVRVLPFGAITSGQKGHQPADMEAMAPYVAGFSDDGRGVQTGALMEEAMLKARALGKIIVAHCEDESLLSGGWIHQGDWAAQHGHVGIPSESEWRQVARDLELVARTGCAYHVCHVSTKESVQLIRQAKKDGLDVSCETAPHYLVLDDSQLLDHGRFKMNPPIRSRADREALVEGLADSTVDMVATDHAPHSLEEKTRGLQHSLNGVVGLETAFPVLYTSLVLPGHLSLARLVEAMSTSPNQRFGIKAQEDWTLFDLGAGYTVRPADFRTLGRSSPFEGAQVQGRCLMTIAQGQLAWQEPAFFNQKEGL